MIFLAPRTGGALLLLGLASCKPTGQAGSASEPAVASLGEVSEVTGDLPYLGREVCFNGFDDNENRLIDEGCDVPQGKVQFVLAWPDEEVDLDLLVTDPTCQVAPLLHATEAGLTRSADCPSEEGACEQNLESVYLDALPLVGGEYQVRVRVEKQREDAALISANLGVRYPGATRAFELRLRRTGEEVFLNFQVPGDESKAPSKAPSPPCAKVNTKVSAQLSAKVSL